MVERTHGLVNNRRPGSTAGRTAADVVTFPNGKHRSCSLCSAPCWWLGSPRLRSSVAGDTLPERESGAVFFGYVTLQYAHAHHPLRPPLTQFG